MPDGSSPAADTGGGQPSSQPRPQDQALSPQDAEVVEQARAAVDQAQMVRARAGLLAGPVSGRWPAEFSGLGDLMAGSIGFGVGNRERWEEVELGGGPPGRAGRWD